MKRFQSTKAIEEYKQKWKKCKYYESNNSMDESDLSVGAKERLPQNIEVLASDTLDSILQHFFGEINKKDSKDYEPSSSAAMESSIDRYLRELNYDYSILNSRFFKGSRNVLEGKTRLLREKGLGKKPNKTNILTRQEEDIQWECG